MGTHRASSQLTCSILGCKNPAITEIRTHGASKTWGGCSSEHIRAVIIHIKNRYPGGRGITTRGVIRIG